MDTKIILGRQFEELAKAYYEKRGFQLISQNLWIGNKEIDLLFRHPEKNVILISEVRGRKSLDIKPVNFLTEAKKRKLIQLAYQIQRRYPSQRIKLQLIELMGEPTDPSLIINVYDLY
jgi:Holliday junction resolvase-like predicted endonuclease